MNAKQSIRNNDTNGRRKKIRNNKNNNDDGDNEEGSSVVVDEDTDSDRGGDNEVITTKASKFDVVDDINNENDDDVEINYNVDVDFDLTTQTNEERKAVDKYLKALRAGKLSDNNEVINEQLDKVIEDVTKKSNSNTMLVEVTASVEELNDGEFDPDDLNDDDRELYYWTLDNISAFRLIGKSGKGRKKQTKQRNDLLKFLKLLRESFEKKHEKLSNGIKAEKYLKYIKFNTRSKYRFLHIVDKEYWSDIEMRRLIMRLLR